MTEIKVNESGQAFFDFDALEKITSRNFVLRVLDILSYQVSESDIKISKFDTLVRVFIINWSAVYVLEYHFRTSDFSEMFLTDFDLESLSLSMKFMYKEKFGVLNG